VEKLIALLLPQRMVPVRGQSGLTGYRKRNTGAKLRQESGDQQVTQWEPVAGLIAKGGESFFGYIANCSAAAA
jgi:hypothetical protein